MHLVGCLKTSLYGTRDVTLPQLPTRPRWQTKRRRRGCGIKPIESRRRPSSLLLLLPSSSSIPRSLKLASSSLSSLLLPLDHEYAHHALAQMSAAISGLPYLEFSVAYLPSDVESPWVEEANRFSKEGIIRHSGSDWGKHRHQAPSPHQALGSSRCGGQGSSGEDPGI